MKSTVIPISLSFGPSHVTVLYKEVKRLTLRIKKDKIIATVPFFTGINSIESFINRNLQWIEKHLIMEEDTEISMLGKLYKITFTEGKPKVEVGDKEIVVHALGGEVNSAKKTLRNWWKRQFREYILTEAEKIYQEVKTAFAVGKMPTISFCFAHSYWGKCFYQKNYIKFSNYLFQADPDTIRYVIYHEFCHCKYHGHDKTFYDALQRFYPDVKGAKMRLKQYQSKLWFDEN